jgi:hypothetical protein
MPTVVDVSDAVEAQRSWRACRGLTPRVFPIQALLELLIDDVRTMRAQGRSDEQICEIVLEATGRHIRPEDIHAVCAQEEVCRAPRGLVGKLKGA